MSGDAGTGQRSLVHPHIEALRRRNCAQDPHGALGEFPDLDHLLVVDFGIFGNVTVRADHHVPGVVGVQVKHRIYVLTASEDQSLVLWEIRSNTKRAVLPRLSGLRLLAATQVDHPMRCVDPLPVVGHLRPESAR